jgi:hypothetical protein
MRHLLHFGFFALVLTAVTRADAQDRRHDDRHTTVVIAAGSGSRVVRPVRASYDPPRTVYDSRQTVRRPSIATHEARRAYFEERQDLDQIVRITERWKQATANRDRYAQGKIDRRLDAWLEREIRESTRDHRYTQHVRMLRDELEALERRNHHWRGYQGRGHHDRGYRDRGYHGHGYHERGHRGYYAKKARILDELVELSERQVYRAQARLRYPRWPSYAYR